MTLHLFNTHRIRDKKDIIVVEKLRLPTPPKRLFLEVHPPKIEKKYLFDTHIENENNN